MHQAHSPQAPPTRYTARTRNQRPGRTWAITPALPKQLGPKGGRRQMRERHDDNWNRNQTKPHHNVPTTAPAPQTEPEASRHASVPRAWTARSIAKTLTEATCRGATPTTSTAPAMEVEGGYQTHTPPAPHTRCIAHGWKKPDTTTQRPKSTPTAAPRRPGTTGPHGRSTEVHVQTAGRH